MDSPFLRLRECHWTDLEAVDPGQCAPLLHLASLFDESTVTATAFGAALQAFEQHEDHTILAAYGDAFYTASRSRPGGDFLLTQRHGALPTSAETSYRPTRSAARGTIIIPDAVEATPTPEEVEQLEQAVAVARTAISHYRECAGQIDVEFESANENRRLGLDDLPFGEEMVRMEPLPDALRRAARVLASPTVTAEAFNEARAIVEDAQETLDDCTPLPPDMCDPE